MRRWILVIVWFSLCSFLLRASTWVQTTVFWMSLFNSPFSLVFKMAFFPAFPAALWAFFFFHATPAHLSLLLSLSRSPHPRWRPHQASWPAYRSAPWWSFQHHVPQLNSRRNKEPHPERDSSQSAGLRVGRKEGGERGREGGGGGDA